MPEKKITQKMLDTTTEHLAQGKSIMSLAYKLGVTRKTVHEWDRRGGEGDERWIEFHNAVEKGRSMGIDMLEDMMLQHARSGEGNATPTLFMLKNRAPDEYNDRKDVKISGDEKAPLVVQTEFKTANEAQKAYLDVIKGNADN